MKQIYRFLSAFLVMGMFFGTGCGTGTAGEQADGNQGSPATETAAEDGQQEDGEEAEDIANMQIDKVTFTAEEPLDYNGWRMEVLGFEEKKKVETEAYTDQAADGKVFLILYLKMKNGTEENHYFAPDNLETKVDGKKVETTYLGNSPHGFDTLYRTYEAKELSGGFLVWEVPQGWKELKMVYHGFEVGQYMTPVLKLKRSDLFEPEEYDPVYLT